MLAVHILLCLVRVTDLARSDGGELSLGHIFLAGVEGAVASLAGQRF